MPFSHLRRHFESALNGLSLKNYRSDRTSYNCEHCITSYLSLIFYLDYWNIEYIYTTIIYGRFPRCVRNSLFPTCIWGGGGTPLPSLTHSPDLYHHLMWLQKFQGFFNEVFMTAVPVKQKFCISHSR